LAKDARLARKILLADDSVTAQNMGRKILTDAGYDVITVNNGSAALKRVAEQKPDLVVLDVYMPGYSGLEVCQRLKDSQETSHIPILLTVGKLEPFKAEEARRVNADAFIIKPFEASELLSALTRLEDRMVPQAEGEGDSGWKSRIRFPSKKKKEEAEPEAEPEYVSPPSFRDFRRGTGKPSVASAPSPVSSAPVPAQEPGLGSEILRDITPEELDALSAVAAKLDGATPAAESIALPADKIGSVAAAAPVEAKTDAEVPPAPAEATSKAEDPAAPVEVKGATEVPAANIVASEVAPASPAAAASAPALAEAPAAESAAAPVVAAVPATPAVADEPAPVDQDDEPLFATAPSATPQVTAVEKSDEPQTATREPGAPPDEVKTAIEAKTEEAQPEKMLSAELISQDPSATATTQETAEAAGPAPSDEELAEALRLLTPSHTRVEAQPPSAHGEAAAAAVQKEAEARWVAEAVALSPEEASLSLETEMFRTFAPPADNTAATSVAAKNDAAENAVTASTEPTAEAPSSVPAVEVLAVGIAAGAGAPEKVEPEPADAPTKQTLDPPEEAAAATFADAVHHDEVEAVFGEESAEPVGRAMSPAPAEASSPPFEEDRVSSSEEIAGGRASMGKETKDRAKSGKSNWHQIRTAPAPAAAAGDVVEEAKQAEESPKSRAAAAAADGSGASDSDTIASIVDSVLADLRPKIVEEIAKKLAKK
jgi:twitching motility two-component system response regulator PilH